MKVILDTNVLLMALPSKSMYHPIIQQFNNRNYDLVLSSEIFLEYEEILSAKANASVAANILIAFIEASNVIYTDIYFRWNLITSDADDNKFIDAYLSAQTDYLVINDKDFNELKRSDYPQINIVTPDEFLKIIQAL